MADIVDKQTRSRMMAGIRGRDTKPEMALRQALHARGFRYRLYVKGLAGRPDVVLPKYRAVIFVHGCFWHRHEGCRFAATPATRPEFWTEKFAGNVRRDRAVRDELFSKGWRIATLWECALRKPQIMEKTVATLEVWLPSGQPWLEVGETDL